MSDLVVRLGFSLSY